MNLAFHPEAEEEFLQAVDYYERCEEGLGLDFALAVHAAVERAVGHPASWPVLEGEVRRCQTVRFPYGILYSVEPDGIFVLAVMHLHRKPGYWERRR
jgi:plasmid stabilization system protein ParE